MHFPHPTSLRLYRHQGKISALFISVILFQSSLFHTVYLLSECPRVKIWWVGQWRGCRGEVWGGTQLASHTCSLGIACASRETEAEEHDPLQPCSVPWDSSDCGRSFRDHHCTQPASHKRSQEKAPGRITLSTQNIRFWLTKSSGFLGKGVWTVDLWRAIKGRNQNALGNSCLPINS